jgi:hypothetical protein
MPEIGQNLAHYSIVEKIGKGGMEEVYRAKDQKLGRDVAIKVLPEEFAKDADRVARFQREAKLLASLNHPNIAAIHRLEEAEGTSFLVLELVEGQTLADRIKASPVPVEESLKLALQIAETLAAALTREPDLGKVPAKTQPLLRRCLEKDPKRRLRDIGEAMAWVEGAPEPVRINRPWLALSVAALEVKEGKAFQTETPKVLFQVPTVGTVFDSWEVASDGSRFLLVTPAAETPPSPFTVVLNWSSLLKK